MKTYEAYRLAIKNPLFRMWQGHMYKAVSSGKTPALAFQFIVDGQRYYYGYKTVHDKETRVDTIQPFFGRQTHANRYLAYINPVIIR